MRFPTFPRTILWAGTLGLAIPLVMMGLFWLHAFRIAEMWLIYIWPSSIMLMATENLGHRFEAFGILAYSIGINVAFYVVVAAILWSLGFPEIITPRWNNDLTMRWSERRTAVRSTF